MTSGEAEGAGGSGRGRLRATVIGIAIALVVGIALTVLAMRDSGQSATAIEVVQRAVAPGLRDAEERIAAQGGRLRVSWSATPSPGGGGHLVTARLVVEPSGDVGAAQFAVTEGSIAAGNDLAERLVDSSEP